MKQLNHSDIVTTSKGRAKVIRENQNKSVTVSIGGLWFNYQRKEIKRVRRSLWCVLRIHKWKHLRIERDSVEFTCERVNCKRKKFQVNP